MRDEFIGRDIEVGKLEWARWFYVYRYYGAEGELLYIGFTADPYTRWRQHRRNSEWAPLAAFVRVERFAYEDLARIAETVAIRTETPRFNVKQTPADDDRNAAMSRQRWADVRESAADGMRLP